ncbi:hypothetical protein LCGC14_1254030 [marine sediment metagenome]|uniref:Uncharacterized protein n=1 Tax=marine sediment metagenome TaxID=412755 RepID=A0A0F9LNV3_9ZZZZ
MSEAKKCLHCDADMDGSYGEITEDRELVVVDEKVQEATILNKGDCLCSTCYLNLTMYRRIRG